MAEQTIRERISQEISEGFSRAGEQFTQSLTRNFSRVTSIVTRQFEDIIGPEIFAVIGTIRSMLSGVMGMFSGVFGMLKSGISSTLGIGKKQKEEESEQTNIIQDTFGQGGNEVVSILYEIRQMLTNIFKIEDKQQEALQSVNQYFEDEKKKQARQPDQEDGGMTIIGALAEMMGIVTGGITAMAGG
ncbi:MAG: hypothetical protein ACOCT9_02765, partial [archaeon]